MFVLLIICLSAGASLWVKHALMQQFSGGTHVRVSAGTGGEWDAGMLTGGFHAKEKVVDSSRFFAPLKKMALWAEKIFPIDIQHANKLQAKLESAGMQVDTNVWRGICVLVIFIGGTLFAYANILLGAKILSIVTFAIFGGICGKLICEAYVYYKKNSYKNSIEQELPDALDILAISVLSGLTLEDGFIETTECLDPKSALAREFSRMNWEVNFCDIPRTKALEEFANRVDSPTVNDFCASTIQALESGGSMAKNLNIQAQAARDIKFDSIREQIAKLDTKMTIPLGLFFMPATGILIMAPVIFNAVTQGLAVLGA